jgi:hypothetical protein
LPVQTLEVLLVKSRITPLLEGEAVDETHWKGSRHCVNHLLGCAREAKIESVCPVPVVNHWWWCHGRIVGG